MLTAYLCLIEFSERNGYIWQQQANEAEEDEVAATAIEPEYRRTAKKDARANSAVEDAGDR